MAQDEDPCITINGTRYCPLEEEVVEDCINVDGEVYCRPEVLPLPPPPYFDPPPPPLSRVCTNYRIGRYCFLSYPLRVGSRCHCNDSWGYFWFNGRVTYD